MSIRKSAIDIQGILVSEENWLTIAKEMNLDLRERFFRTKVSSARPRASTEKRLYFITNYYVGSSWVIYDEEYCMLRFDFDRSLAEFMFTPFTLKEKLPWKTVLTSS